jgi:hypothetical protein
MMALPVIVIVGLLVAGGGIIMSTHMAAARSTDNNSTAISLGNPFFLEKGRIIGQRVLSVNPLQVEFTVAADATINEDINATNTGTSEVLSSPQGDSL